MARLHQRRGAAARSIRSARVDALAADVLAFARADRARRPIAQDALYRRTPSRRGASPARSRLSRAGAAARLRRPRGAARRARLVQVQAAAHRAADRALRARRAAASRCSTRTRRSWRALEDVHARRRRRSRGAAARRAVRPRSTPTRRPRRAPARSTSSTCWCARATWCATARDVRAAFQQRFTHLFVDEFQDTDPLQAEILLLLAADDPAETRLARACGPRPASCSSSAIRSSRSTASAAPTSASTRRCASSCVRHGAALRRAAQQLPRACPTIQRAVNARVRAAHDRRRRGACRRTTCRSRRCGRPSAGQPAVVALPVPQPYGCWHGEPTKASIDRVAAATRSPPSSTGWCTTSGWTVTDRERPDERVPIQARHVCLLFRRFDTRRSTGRRSTSRGPTSQALEARGVPHVLVGGKTLPRARGGRDAAHRARRDRVAGRRAVGLRDAARRALRVRRRRAARLPRRAPRPFHPFRALDAGRRAAASGAASRGRRRRSTLLRELHLRRNQRPVADTIAALLDATRAHASFALRPTGEQALANVQYVGELARQYEARRRPVVPRLRRAAARRSGGDARRRGADPRGGQRRRPADDRAQGQGARVPGRRARRHRAPSCRAGTAVALGGHATARAARSAWPAGRPPSCGSTKPTRWRATRPKASASPTSPRRAPAICSSSAPSATCRRPGLGRVR